MLDAYVTKNGAKVLAKCLLIGTGLYFGLRNHDVLMTYWHSMEEKFGLVQYRHQDRIEVLQDLVRFAK